MEAATGEQDRQRMRRALELAERGRYGTSPNPMVGAVVADTAGQVVGEGYHAAFGSAHAEVAALAEAGDRARGGTLWVTLEPCNHHGKTPPCVDAILAAGIARVVLALGDPSPQASGGAERLRRAGLCVEEGVEASASAFLNRRWLCRVRRGRPWVTLKTAVSLDGRIATRTGHSQWITGEQARRRGLELREEHDAILVGASTVAADDPRLTRRLGLNPVRRWQRLVLDSRLRTLPTARLVADEPQLTTMIHGPEVDAARRDALAGQGVRLHEAALDETGRIALEPMLDWLAAEGLAALLVEGGATVAGSFADRGLVDEAFVFVAPMIIGGPAPACIGGKGIARLEAARGMRFESASRVGDDLELHAVAQESTCSPA